MLIRQRDKLSASLGGIKQMGGLPDMIFVIDVQLEKTAIQEANRLKIPVAAIVDTNSNPENIEYLVPGNDDAIRAVRLYCKTIADRIITVKGKMALTEKKVIPKHEKEKGPIVVTKKEKTASIAAKQAEDDKEPVEKKPANKKPTEKTDVAKNPSVKKPAAKKPAAKKPAAKKPAAKKDDN
jgi:small subunit ribosomal protein S2